MKKSPHFIAWYAADWAAATLTLPTIERGVYISLVNHYYSTGEPLADDMDELLSACGRGATAASVEKVLNRFFRKVKGQWHHDRCDSEISRSKEKHAERSATGKIGAQRRWHGKQSDSSAMAQPKLSDSSALANGDGSAKAQHYQQNRTEQKLLNPRVQGGIARDVVTGTGEEA